MSGVWQRGSEELLDELRESEKRMWREYATTLELIAELDQRNAAAECGYSNLPTLLRDVLRISLSEAKRRIGHAHAVTEVPLVSGGTVAAPLPATGAAARAGLLGPEHIEVIGRSLTGLPLHVQPEAIAQAEQTMVTAAANLDARTLARVGTRVRTMLDQDGPPPNDDEPANPVNELHLKTKPNGHLALRGELEPEASALLQSLLSPLTKPRPTTQDGPDPRSLAERQGDALVELLHLAAGNADLPTEAGEKPHLMLTMPLQALREAIGTAQLDGLGELSAATARRIACDCKIIPVVLGANSEPLDIGRASYTVPTALRRALVLRDNGCAFPGCDRPHRWCHAHHLQHWADGGTTDLNNLVLLCGTHHRLLHHSPWQCTIINGQPEFIPPRFIDPTRTPRHNNLRC